MKTRYLITLFLTLLVSVHINAAAPSEAEFVKLEEQWQLHADGSQEFRQYKELKLFTHTAMNGTYGQTTINYDPRYQQVRIHASYTLQKDGTRIDTPENAFVEVLPRNAAGMPEYNSLKELVVVHTGLELGATIVLDYSIISSPGYLTDIDICRKLQQSSPVRQYRMSFTFPEGKQAHYQVLARKEKPSDKISGGSRTLTWNFRNLPALPRVPGISLQNGDIPGIVLNTYEDSRAAFSLLWGQFEGTAAFDGMARKLTAGKETADEKMDAIVGWVRNALETTSLAAVENGWRFRKSAEVIASAYGTEIEKLNLLNGLLNAAGIPSEPACSFDLDVTPEACGPAAASQWFLLVSLDGKTVRTGIRSGAETAAGCSFIKRLKDGSVERNTVSPHRISVNREISWKDADLEKVGKHVILHFPESDSILSTYGKWNSTRCCNALLPCTFDESCEYRVVLPDGVRCCSEDRSVETKASFGHCSISIRCSGNVVTVTRKASVHERVITPKDWPSFHKMASEWYDDNLNSILLEQD